MRRVRIGCDARLYVDGRVEMLCEEERRMKIMRVGSKGAEVLLGHRKRIACIVPSMDQCWAWLVDETTLLIRVPLHFPEIMGGKQFITIRGRTVDVLSCP